MLIVKLNCDGMKKGVVGCAMKEERRLKKKI